MKKYWLLLLVVKAFSLSISTQDAEKIGEKIWKNECAGTVEGLTHWNKGEDFASLGIGHFIWYSAGKKERFEETFPALLKFLQKEGVIIPSWLKDSAACPWNSRDAFCADAKSPKMKDLRQLLLDTRSLQAVFMANRLEGILPLLIERCSLEEKEKVSVVFSRLVKDSNGLYALLDYLNFKGSGISPRESYQGQGWGLLQVLQRIPASSSEPLVDFVKAAKFILQQRVKNSPSERNEEKWLKGWFNRLDTY
jgi:hypothetical protein